MKILNQSSSLQNLRLLGPMVKYRFSHYHPLGVEPEISIVRRCQRRAAQLAAATGRRQSLWWRWPRKWLTLRSSRSTLGMALSPCLGQTTNPDEPSASSLSVPGSQCREAPPNPNPTTGIQSEIVIPRAKAVAAVVSPHSLDPQDNPPVTTGIQSDSVALSSKKKFD